MRPDAEAELRKELDWNEQLLWCGQPVRGLDLSVMIVAIMVFGLVMSGSALAATRRNLGSGDTGAAVAFPLIFAAVGLSLVVFPLIVDPYRRRWTFYGLSDQRVFIISEVWRRSVLSAPLATMVEANILLDRTGTIKFADLTRHSFFSEDGPVMLEFSRVPNATSVRDQIRSAIRRERERSSRRDRVDL
jgi:hypothetical protein